ncbi:MAG: ABC transporter transmembrane domain-containing protein [Defluviitaleaceae bacterium]|nr:ABC transporter transmembrane domain-containing protein [Defluviitaleaceae bacterium]
MKRKGVLVAIFAMNIITSVLTIYSTYFSGLFLDTLIEVSHISDMYTVIFIFLSIILFSIIFRFIHSLILPQVKERFVYDFKIKILSSKKELSEKNIAYLSKRIDEDTRQVIIFFVENFSTWIIKSVEIAIVSTIVFSINWHIGIVMVIVCPIYFGLYTLFKKPIFNRSIQVREESSKFFGDYANEIVKKDFEESFIKDSFYSYLKKYKNYLFVSIGLSSSQSLIIGLVQIVVFFIGGISVINGNTTIGLLSIVMMYFNQVISNISYYLELGRKWQVAAASIHRIDELIEIK